MTMQTTNPLLAAVTAGATATRNVAPERSADKARDNGGFGATLSRELAARQQTPQPAAQAPAAQAQKSQQQQSKPNAADKPAHREPVREPARDGAARAGAKPVGQEGETKTAPATAREDADKAEDGAVAAAAAPATEMLAFMASLTQPATAAATVAETALAAAGGGEAGEQQLTALENALQNMTGKGVATDDAAGVTTDDAGPVFALATGVQRAPVEAITSQDAGQAGAALPDDLQDASQFQAQLRETQQQAIPAAEEAPAPLAALQAQAAKLDAAGNPAAGPGDRIPARVGTQAWDNQVSQRIVYMVGKEQAATLTLNPPDLGPVQIVLNVSNDQATVAFSSDQLEVRQALENAMPRLREMMSESGIALGNATVDAGAPGRQQQDGERRAQGGNGAGNLADGDRAAEPALNEVAPRTRTVGLGERGMVDLFA